VAGLLSEVGYFGGESFYLGGEGGYFSVFGCELFLVFSVGRFFLFSERSELVRKGGDFLSLFFRFLLQQQDLDFVLLQLLVLFAQGDSQSFRFRLGRLMFFIGLFALGGESLDFLLALAEVCDEGVDDVVLAVGFDDGFGVGGVDGGGGGEV